MKIPQPSRVRTRVRIATLSLVLLSTIAVTVSALHFVKVGMQAAILQEQAGRVADIATDIDDRLSSRKILLRTLAAALLTLPGDDPQQNLQAFSVVTAAFDNVSVISSAGDVIANLRGSAPVGKLNVADRGYFTETLSSRKGVISEPLRNRFSGKPQIIITEPLSNMDGTAAKVLAGSIDLQENSFLGGLGGTQFGASGYLFIVNNNALVIHHPERQNLLKQEPNRALREYIRDNIHAMESGKSIVWSAGDTLYAFQRIRQTDWIVGAALPHREAFSPIEAVQNKAIAVAIIFALLAGALANWIVQSQLRPLARLHDHIAASRLGTNYVPLEGLFAADEIGDLARSFNGMMRQRQLVRSQLVENQKLLREIADHLPAFVSHINDDGIFSFANKPLVDRYDLESAAFVGARVTDVFGDDELAVFTPHIAEVMRGNDVTFELAGSSRCGDTAKTYQAHLLPDFEEDGTVRGYYMMTFDVTERKASEEKLVKAARTDHLTALPNRTVFHEVLPAALERSNRTGRGVALLYFDIDHFKAINDTLGHAAGDAVLQEFSLRLGACVRVTDTVARLGGDEFIAILENLQTVQNANEAVVKLRHYLTALPIAAGDKELKITISVGVAFRQGRVQPMRVDDFIAHADGALYKVKAAGRDGYETVEC